MVLLPHSHFTVSLRRSILPQLTRMRLQQKQHSHLARPASPATPSHHPSAAFDGVSPSPLLDPLHTARTILTMERLGKLPRPCSSSVATPSSPHSYGQNHEREKTTRTMQQQKLVEVDTSAGASAGVGSGSHFGVGLMLLSVLLVLSTLMAPAAARTIAYCSDVNTGSDYDSGLSRAVRRSRCCGSWADAPCLVINEFQSHGLCYDNCNAGSYAFAIVQGAYCWCSNYVPGVDVDGSECSEECPGYPDDSCGNTQKNLFGYMALARKPSGTKGAETTVSTTSTSPTNPTNPNTPTNSQAGPITTVIIVRLLPSCIC